MQDQHAQPDRETDVPLENVDDFSAPADSEEPTVVYGDEESEPESPREQAQGGNAEGESAGPDPLSLIDDRLLAIEAGVAEFHDRARRYEDINMKMNDTVSDLKQQSDRTLLKPVFTKLATLAADAELFADEASDNDRQSFYSFLDSIEDLFSMYDLLSVNAKVGEAFDPSRHTAIQRKLTEDQSLDGTVARVTRQGFTFSGDSRPYLPAQVAVWRYSAPEQSKM